MTEKKFTLGTKLNSEKKNTLGTILYKIQTFKDAHEFN